MFQVHMALVHYYQLENKFQVEIEIVLEYTNHQYNNNLHYIVLMAMDCLYQNSRNQVDTLGNLTEKYLLLRY
jgi:hypothetical protein